MRGNTFSRTLLLLIAALSFAVFVAGCGDDNEDGSKTSEGAPAGATGNADGGFAVEAGKKRTEEDIKAEQAYSPEPPPVQLAAGERSDYKVKKPTILIIRSEKELESTRRKLGLKPTEVAPVDFKTRQAVLAQMPKEPSGTLMQIKDVSVGDAGTIRVRVARVVPGEGCKVAKRATNPFNLVETRKMTEKETKVEIEDVNNSPC